MAKVTGFVEVMFLTIMVCNFAASTPYKVKLHCPKGTFYDHVTELCESCSVMCKDRPADDVQAMDDCHRLCAQTSAQLSSKELQPQLSVISPDPHHHHHPSSGTQATLSPTTLGIVVSLLIGTLLLSLFLGAYVCKHMQENPGPSGSGSGGVGQQGLGSAERGLNRSRQGYRPAGVHEEGSEQAPQPSGRAVRAYCDPRQWFAADPPEEETPPPARQGAQEASLLGNKHSAAVQDLIQPKTVVTSPIYKPSGSMRSTRI